VAQQKISSTTGWRYDGESMPKTCGDPARYTMWTEQKTKEGSSASPVFSVYDEESDN
jgi:hypothetical protein